MKWISLFFRELLGLFIDDGSLAIAIVAWILIAGFARPMFASLDLQMIVWVVVLIVLLLENVIRSARRARKERAT